MRKFIIGVVIAIIVIFVAYLLLSGKGLSGLGLGSRTADGEAEKSVTASTAADAEDTDTTPSDETESDADAVEIRIQGREYNYQNITYGNGEHPLEDLIEALDELPRDTRIVLIVEDNATKNAVDDLEKSLLDAGFVDIQ